MKYVNQSRVIPWDGLTEVQRNTYLYILRYLNENHFPPANREIMEALGLRSTAPVTQRLDQLQMAGWITRIRGAPRTIRLIQHQPIWLPVAHDQEVA
jgi:SOS-response transcriptional repressor LexA